MWISDEVRAILSPFPIFFNNLDLTNWLFPKQDKGRGLLEREITMITVPGRPGGIITGKRTPARFISQEVLIACESAEELRKKLEELNEILHTETSEPLQFGDELDRTYFAMYAGAQEGYEIDGFYTATINFLCSDPYKYAEPKKIPFADSAVTMYNNGTVEVEPIITINVASPSTFLSLGDGTEKFNQIGRQIDVSNEEPYNKYTEVFDRLGNNLTGWAIADEIDGGTVQGSFLTDGQGFRANSYGATSTLWRGPALKQSLPSLTQDFRIDAFITVKQEATNQFGRAEVYLLNAAGERIAKLAMKNTGELNSSNIGEINIRGIDDSHNIIQTAGVRPRLWNDFYGVLRLERIGNKFTAYISRIDKGIYNTAWSGTFTDYEGLYLDPLAAIQIHVGQSGANTFISDMAIHRVIVYRVNDPLANQVPNIVEAGDEVVFDHVNKNILINGESRIDLKDFAGRYFTLPKGKNTLYMLPSDIGTAKIEIRERYR